jgi:exodeoxyribonuclease V alpha subunit
VPHIATSEAVRAAIPLQASTIHRLLGVREHSTQFRHDAGRQLPCDVVVVDEASMVDLALMSKLVEAVPERARLILLGDKDQLASVEAGAVLGELCAGGAGWSAAMAARLSRLSGQAVAPEPSDDAAIGDAVVVLRHSYRFGAASGIGQLAGAVNRGDAAAALRVLEEGAFADVSHWVPAQNQALEQAVIEEAAAAYGDFFDAVVCGAAPAAVFDAFNRFRFLCAHRLGPASAGQVNELITRWVRRRYRYYGDDPWYAGRPVMVVRNDYATGLFNGDVGVALPDAEREGRLGVFFQGADGAIRGIAPVRLPPHETVYAMTVHKSQGTEFDRVTLILPERASGVVSRELVYTGLTRARRRVRIVASPAVLRRAITHRLARASGLRDQLRWRDSAGSQ